MPTNKRGHVTKNGDPLAGVEAVDWVWCKKANCPVPSSYGKGHRFILANGVNDCDGKDHFSLVQKPAVRKAMVEWLNGEARKIAAWTDADIEAARNIPGQDFAEKVHAKRGMVSIVAELADRLERGGGER